MVPRVHPSGRTKSPIGRCTVVCYRTQAYSGLKECIKIDFLRQSPLPKAEACFCIVKLPTVHTSRNVFFSKVDNGYTLGTLLTGSRQPRVYDIVDYTS